MAHTGDSGHGGLPGRVPPHPQAETAQPPEDAGHPPTQAAHPPAQAGQRPAEVTALGRPARIARYGPGVPAQPGPAAGPASSPAGPGTAGRPPAQPRSRLRRAGEPALTVLLLAASAVVFILRFAHSGGLQITGATITGGARAGCAVTLAGRIATNGQAGTVSYQWQIGPGGPQPRALSQSVVAGQHTVDVTAALTGAGFGRAARTVTLRVLDPGPAAAATRVAISC
jgi:hypothetical protein